MWVACPGELEGRTKPVFSVFAFLVDKGNPHLLPSSPFLQPRGPWNHLHFKIDDALVQGEFGNLRLKSQCLSNTQGKLLPLAVSHGMQVKFRRR